jgi:transcriptional regulator of acetoin/glycerol metabolism
VTPAHARPALEEVAQLVGLVSLGGGAAEVESWGVFVQAAVRGDRDAEQILSRVAALRDAAGTRRRAAERLGVHRNTLTRHLAALAERVGRDPWGEGA